MKILSLGRILKAPWVETYRGSVGSKNFSTRVAVLAERSRNNIRPVVWEALAKTGAELALLKRVKMRVVGFTLWARAWCSQDWR